MRTQLMFLTEYVQSEKHHSSAGDQTSQWSGERFQRSLFGLSDTPWFPLASIPRFSVSGPLTMENFLLAIHISTTSQVRMDKIIKYLCPKCHAQGSERLRVNGNEMGLPSEQWLVYRYWKVRVYSPNFQVSHGTLEKWYLRMAVQWETRSVHQGRNDVISTKFSCNV